MRSSYFNPRRYVVKLIVKALDIETVGLRLSSKGLEKIIVKDNRDGTSQMEFTDEFVGESGAGLTPILQEVNLLSEQNLVVRVCYEEN